MIAIGVRVRLVPISRVVSLGPRIVGMSTVVLLPPMLLLLLLHV